MHRDGHERLKEIETDRIAKKPQSRSSAIMHLMPLAHTCCNSNKSRVQIGFLTKAEYEPGKLANPTSWFKPAMFDQEGERLAQADTLEALEVATVFLRLESGHSNQSTVADAAFVPSQFPNRYLVHGTNEKNLQSIRQRGLLPGGTRGGRQDVHCSLCLRRFLNNHAR